MKLAAVIGDPISHSKSPKVHGHWLSRYGINGAYVPLHVTADDLGQTLDLLPRLGFRGCNVTLPHKEAVFARADQVTDRAARMGAANTLTFRDGQILADNTDSLGFLSNLRAGSEWTADTPVVVLGAGGAARGVLDALTQAGVPEIRLSNRTRAKADALAELFPNVVVAEWLPDLSGAGLVVNTTALGMAGQPPLEVDLTALSADAVVTDIVYTPLETPLLAAARGRGLTTVDGLGMLLHQAVPGFAAWFGQTPQVDDALRAAVLE